LSFYGIFIVPNKNDYIGIGGIWGKCPKTAKVILKEGKCLNMYFFRGATMKVGTALA